MGTAAPATEGRSRPAVVWVFLGSVLVAGVVALWLVPSWKWPVPGKANVHPDTVTCPGLREDDDLVHLALRRSESEARAHLARWSKCDETKATTLTDQAEEAIKYDFVLVVALALVVGTASVLMRRQTRWRLAADVGMVLAVAYECADLYENVQLNNLLHDRGEWSVLLPISAAVKFGTLIAALPLVGGALFVLRFGEPPESDLANDERPRSSFWRRWSNRRRGLHAPEPALKPSHQGATVTAPEPRKDEGVVGVCCSGGGIRSAAFSLGALQALDERAGTNPSELSKARWLFSVSGGSYISAAWVTARTKYPDGDAWARGSFEEDFLRRHASYLAPGVGGKLWAILFYLLALIANVGLVLIAVGALFLPAGWLIATGVERQPVEAGVVGLPEGGCIELTGGSLLAVLPGTSLELTSGTEVFVGPGAVVPPEPKPATAKATATAEGPPPVAAKAVVAGTTTTTAPPDQAARPGPSCEAAYSAANPVGALRGDAPGRLFEEGAGVPIRPGSTVHVRSGDHRVSGCHQRGGQEPACPVDAAEQHVVPSGSRLRSAPAAQLTLRGDAVFGTGGRLDRACGVEGCKRFRPGPWLSWIPGAALGVLALSGLALVTMREDPRARKKVQKQTRWIAVGTALVVILLWAFPRLVVSLGLARSWLEQRAEVVGGASGGTILLALLAQLRSASAKSDKPAGRVPNLVKSLGGRLRPLLLRLAAMVAGPVLLVLTALLFAFYGASWDASFGQITVAIVMAGWLVVYGACGDLNRWSLHPYYRERLRSAFAADRESAEPRDELLRALPQRPKGLELTMCATANLADDRVTPPGRPALPWTFSRDEMGSSPGTGCYTPGSLPDRFDYLRRVWTSVAVSGAAFAPAMGKMSRPERFLMALGNLRLGLWYPNPIYFQSAPPPPSESVPDFDRDWYEWHHPRLWYLFKEAVGLHKLRDPWVYVTDGGHYENLGLVELLRTTRCREVYCFDAAGDATHTFSTFADAQRLAREEWQIEIDLDPRAMADDNGISKVGVWAGTVRYPDPGSEPGWIVLAKLSVPLSAPFDILDRARTLPSFPTHPTADQLYTDSKFEAYRALGHHLGREAVAVGTRLRRLTELTAAPDAVRLVNEELCQRRDPHPCPPPKPGAKGDGE